MVNSLLRRANLGIRKVQTQRENLKVLYAKHDDRSELAESCHNFCSEPKFKAIRSVHRWYFCAVEN